jgi:hypothetical protein
VRTILRVGGWWLREDNGYYSVTWAPLGLAVLIIRERGLWGLARRFHEIPGRIASAKQHAIEEHGELDRLRALQPDGEDELRDFDPTQAGGGGPCAWCRAEMQPWYFGEVCQGCLWDESAGHRRTVA